MEGVGGNGLPSRIAVIGVPGAGKTTLSRELARMGSSEHICADSYIWDPGWSWRAPHGGTAEFRAALRAPGDWIADGSVDFGGEDMLRLSDLVIYLDYSWPRLLVHNVRRWLLHRKRQRPELPPGCEEKFPAVMLLRLAAGGPRRRHERALLSHAPRRLARVTSPRELRTFVDAHFTGGSCMPGKSC